MNKRELYTLFKTSLKEWQEDNAVLRAGALTFFIILPLPTLLLLVIGIFAQFYGEAQAIQIIVQQIAAVAGPAVADLFRELITSTGSPFTSVFSSIVVIGFSIGGAIGAFSVLRDTMDRIWDVRAPKGLSLWTRIRQKIFPFIIVSALGLIVIAWTGIASRLFNLITLYSINDTLTIVALTVAEALLSFGVSTLLLAIIYKMIPQATVHWHDVGVAAVVTGIAFTVANYIFGSYIQTFPITTVAGAAGSLLIILLWIFVLNQIVLFGAEVSKTYATTAGVHAKQHLPSAVKNIIEPITRAGQAIEQATKGPVESTTKSEDKKETSEQVLPAPETPASEEAKQEPQSPPEHPEDHQHGSVEVKIKVKLPPKEQPEEE
ncbi:MAG: YihY/virulence factor BrkB family protein [Candidatus Bathyarchaeota archaeon]|nr:YihY/virulence factor BrkB family protein [Candidatus Bathyarchaeota archaeon]